MSDVVIVGGTGTLGQELARQMLLRDPKASIGIFSRDELKQQQMRRAFGDYRGLRFVIGDVRDPKAIARALYDTETVFHVAALKHLDVCEENPVEAWATNVTGTHNVADVALDRCIPHVVFSSTDKAVLPVNTYGHCKALCERYLLGLNAKQHFTRFSVFRWANVLGSRGSVVHRFAETLTAARRVDVTDPEMTRFWIRIEDAVRFMLDRHAKAPLSTVSIPPMKAASVVRLAASVARVLGVRQYHVNVIGQRPGEKVHEAIDWTKERGLVTSDTAEQYSDSELDEMVRPLFAKAAA